MTESTSPGVTRSKGRRARANERPTRCDRRKTEDGKLCRRNAGAGTDHPGEGPCANHDDGTWARVAFAENVEAREAFLAAVEADRGATTRSLIEPLGYHKRDVSELEKRDPEFAARLLEARGQDDESLRREWYRRAFDCESDRLLELKVKTQLPEAAVLRQTHTRLDGQIDVRPVYGNLESLDLDGISEARRRQIAACKTEFDLAKAVLGWMQPAPHEVPRDGRPALELLPGGGS